MCCIILCIFPMGWRSIPARIAEAHALFFHVETYYPQIGICDEKGGRMTGPIFEATHACNTGDEYL